MVRDTNLGEPLADKINEIAFDVMPETGSDQILILIIFLWVCTVDVVMALYVHRQPHQWRKNSDQVEKDTISNILEEEAVQVVKGFVLINSVLASL